MSIEKHYNETYVARLASREKQMQQSYRPVISVHKWFARRPGALFRSLILAELVDERVDASYAKGHELAGVCCDPFMGGGTPIFEASRLGMSVLGYDTNPMARWVVERELEDVDPAELREVGERVAVDVEQKVRSLYITTCPDCGTDAEVRYFLWLRHHACVCGEEHPLLADTMLVSTGLKRHPREVHLCPACLVLSECLPGKRPVRCRSCHARYDDGLVVPDSTHACTCGRAYRIPPQGTIETPRMRLVAIEYHCTDCATKPKATRHSYKVADQRDHRLVKKAERLAVKHPSDLWPDELIPSGVETERLLRWGYNQWRDLFNARQLYGLGVLASRISQEPEGPVKRALQTAFSDFLRYQTMLCRYDGQALKPTDVFALHGFPVPRVSCECALLGKRGVGSGGYRHALAKYVRAKQWCREPYETILRGDRLQRVHTTPEALAPVLVADATSLPDHGAACLRRASLGPTDLAAASVDLVLTDPPYYANVQYAELMNFCFTWLRKLAPDTSFFDVPSAKTDQDAVGTATQAGVDVVEVTRRLSKVYRAAATALKPSGAFIFTYHHNDLTAYAPLVVACLDAGLEPTRLYGCPSEMRASKHIYGRNASTVDTVFVLRKPPLPAGLFCAFSSVAVHTVVSARLAALRRAGMTPTSADRACVRHSVLAARAMAGLASSWDANAAATVRVARALEALGAAPLRAAARPSGDTASLSSSRGRTTGTPVGAPRTRNALRVEPRPDGVPA
jgi:adenine-specific DNA methylase